MSSELERQVREWLNAERDGADERAERALTGAFARLGRRAPGRGFADRVLLRAGYLAPEARAWSWPWVRGAVAASLVASGLALAALPLLWLVVPPLVRAVGSPMVVMLSRYAARWMASGIRTGALVADVGSALQAALATPAAVALLTANVLLAAASLAGLKRLLKAPEESTPW